MMHLGPFLKVFPVLLCALISPGPSFVMVSNLSLAKGRRAGIECAAGMGTSDFIYAALSLLGLGLLLATLPELMFVVKVLGGLYLIYLGFIILRSTFRKTSLPTVETPSQEKSRNAFRLGLLTSLTNPKVIIFYGSILTVAMGTNSPAMTKILMAPFCGMIAFLWYGFVAVALSIPKLRAKYEEWSSAIDRVSGAVLFLFGVLLIVSG